MTTADPGTSETPSPTAGASLSAAREAAGLSIDAVAQQLKLAPRQVRAIEAGDYTLLPGRTFVRGFVRNYARLLRLDPETVLRELPPAASSPALEAPTLQPTAPTIGELPVGEHARAGWGRWAIPAVLAAAIVAASVYEWMRPAGVPRDPAAGSAVFTEAVPRPAAPTPQSPSPPAAAPVQRDANSAVPAQAGAGPANALPGTAPSAAADGSAAPQATPAAADGTAAPQGKPDAGAGAAATAAAPTSAAPSPAPRSAAPDATLLLSFRDYSWTEVRDRDGRVVFSRMNPGGSVQTISAPPPLAVVIGNAADVRVVYNGRPVDLLPHIRQNVARFTLQ